MGWKSALTSELKKRQGFSCSYGTQNNQCSTTKPMFCQNGQLINKASQCGCPSGQTVQWNSCVHLDFQTPSRTTINFDDLGYGITVNNQYSSKGVMFSSTRLLLYNLLFS